MTGDDREERDPRRERDPRTGRSAARARIEQQSSWVDQQIRQAIARGDFDDLPGYGRPLPDLDGRNDPDWWVKKLVEREQITGVLPPSLQIRKEDAELDGRLDRLSTEAEVRQEVADFNERVRWALYRPPEGPPMVTRSRDADVEVERWRRRRAERVAAQRAARDRLLQEAAARRRLPLHERIRALGRRTRGPASSSPTDGTDDR